MPCALCNQVLFVMVSDCLQGEPNSTEQRHVHAHMFSVEWLGVHVHLGGS